MREIFKRVGMSVLRAAKRFLGNRPSNAYETIVFNAIRLAATQLGTGRTKIA